MDGNGKVNTGPALASAATYKKMKGKAAPADTTAVAKPAPTQSPDPTKPLSPTNPLMTDHADGTYRQWGEDIKLPPIPPELGKKKVAGPAPSDKAAGQSNAYYPSNQQNKGKAVPTTKSNNY